MLAEPATAARTFWVASSNTDIAEVPATPITIPAGYAFATIPVAAISEGIYHLDLVEDGQVVASSARRVTEFRNLASPPLGDSAEIPPPIPPIPTQVNRICQPAAPVSGVGSYQECGPCTNQSGSSNTCSATVIISKPARCRFMQSHTCSSAGSISLQSQRMVLAGSELKSCGTKSTENGFSILWGLIEWGTQTASQQELEEWCCSYVPADDGPTGTAHVPECQ